ncbi:MAG: GNAT family N-acetyltransferase [Parabacteroides sp.]|nr:GNAT family N-acetyltransferase [Parabacteroides sp.]
MDILEITRKQDPLFSVFKQVYAASFPIFEQRTEEQQERAFQSPNYHLAVYLKENRFIGFISYWNFSTYIYIEHLAIHENFRGQGYGSSLLDEFNKRQHKTLLLEIDPITDEVSANRLKFYKKCGFFENGYKHIHPPYRNAYQAHPLIILTTARPITEDEYIQFSFDLRDIVMAN